MPRNDQALLTRLKDSGLDFVVIGGVCVVFHGAPIIAEKKDQPEGFK